MIPTFAKSVDFGQNRILGGFNTQIIFDKILIFLVKFVDLGLKPHTDSM